MNTNEAQFPKIKKCLYCGKEIICKNKTIYDKTKYCSRKCVNSCPIHQKMMREKMKEAFKKSEKKEEHIQKLIDGCRKSAKKRHQDFLNKKVVMKDGWTGKKQELDITYGELGDYRKSHHVCEICGREEVAINNMTNKVQNLSADHNHLTGHFRGLLCKRCNRALGWYETYEKSIKDYLVDA